MILTRSERSKKKKKRTKKYVSQCVMFKKEHKPFDPPSAPNVFLLRRWRCNRIDKLSNTYFFCLFSLSVWNPKSTTVVVAAADVTCDRTKLFGIPSASPRSFVRSFMFDCVDIFSRSTAHLISSKLCHGNNDNGDKINVLLHYVIHITHII